MLIQASEGVCWPWWCDDMKMYRYDVHIELTDGFDTISDDYESFGSEKDALKRIEHINKCKYSNWMEFEKGERK